MRCSRFHLPWAFGLLTAMASTLALSQTGQPIRIGQVPGEHARIGLVVTTPRIRCGGDARWIGTADTIQCGSTGKW